MQLQNPYEKTRYSLYPILNQVIPPNVSYTLSQNLSTWSLRIQFHCDNCSTLEDFIPLLQATLQKSKMVLKEAGTPKLWQVFLIVNNR